MLTHKQTQGARVLVPTKLLFLASLLAGCVSSAEASASPGTVGTSTVEGGLDKSAVRETVRTHIDEIRVCYNAELVEDEAIEGGLVISFLIEPDGSASEVGVQESSMPERFDACVLTAVAGWSFPASDDETRVTYPFLLSPG